MVKEQLLKLLKKIPDDASIEILKNDSVKPIKIVGVKTLNYDKAGNSLQFIDKEFYD